MEPNEFIGKSKNIAKEEGSSYIKDNVANKTFHIMDPSDNLLCRRCYKFHCLTHATTNDGILLANPHPLASQMKSIKSHAFKSLNDLEPHYTPCKCQVSCESQCHCFHQGGCEKFCGCPKTCKNRNKGCECYNSSCATNECPCFISKRECDPDICKNCKLGCGDGSLGYLIVDNGDHKCENMKIFLKHNKKLLFRQSEISDWGVFLKSNVGKDEFIGEYRGELLAKEDDDDTLTVKIYMSSENEKKIGSLLKFTKHSKNPNCYTKIVKVLGDNKVGVYSTRDIQAGEKLLVDYNLPLLIGQYWINEQGKNKHSASWSYSTKDQGSSSGHENMKV